MSNFTKEKPITPYLTGVCVLFFFFFIKCGSIGREMLAGKMLAKSRAAYGAFYTAWQLGK